MYTTLYGDTADNTLHTMHLQKHKQTKMLTDGHIGRYKQSCLTGKSDHKAKGNNIDAQCQTEGKDASQTMTVVCCTCLHWQGILSQTLGIDGNSLATLLRITRIMRNN